MKFWQGAVCGFVLTVTAIGQQTGTTTSAAKPAAPAPQAGATASDAGKAPEHPLTLEQMKQLYTAMGYDKLFEDNRQTMMNMQKERAPFIPQDVWDDFDATSKKVDYPAAFLPVYQKYLSTEDAAKAIDFSKTEAGKHFLETIPGTQREIGAVLQKEQQQVGQEVQTRHKDEIEAAVKKYREDHAPKPALSSPGSPSAPSGSSAPASPNPPASTSTPAAPAPATPAPTTPQNPQK